MKISVNFHGADGYRRMREEDEEIEESCCGCFTWVSGFFRRILGKSRNRVYFYDMSGDPFMTEI